MTNRGIDSEAGGEVKTEARRWRKCVDVKDHVKISGLSNKVGTKVPSLFSTEKLHNTRNFSVILRRNTLRFLSDIDRRIFPHDCL